MGREARVLILGSFPGERSLQERRYYANAQNRFWSALAPFCGVSPAAGYHARLRALHRSGIALWDVLGACRREGSLDQRIVRGSEEPNDLGSLVGAHPELRAILLNGRSVAEFFHRHQIPRDFWGDLDLTIETMPSTSPAHAAMRPAEVVRIWTDALARFTPAAATRTTGR